MDKLVARMKASDMAGVGETCLRFQPFLLTSLGNSLRQIMSALSGGMSGGSGYGFLGQNVGLYGPNVQLAGKQGRGRDRPAPGSNEERVERSATDAADEDLPRSGETPRVKLQRDVKFPLRYRKLVGEYFRVIAETE
jgi:hypothetical protein